MDNKSELLIQKEEKGVFYILFNRPGKKNALLEPMREKLAKSIEKVKTNERIKVCVIGGIGNSFCAGGDLNSIRQLVTENKLDEIEKYMDWMIKAVLGIRSLEIPVLAAINGPAIGSGMNIALACDLRVASEIAKFGQPYINIGLYPDWGGTYFLPRFVGPSRALELFWSGRIFGAGEALSLGLVDYVFREQEFQNKIDEMVVSFAEKSNPLLVKLKRNVRKEAIEKLKKTLEEEKIQFLECLETQYFLEKISGFGKK